MIAATIAALTMGGTVVAWMVKIEGRLMRLETVIRERIHQHSLDSQ